MPRNTLLNEFGLDTYLASRSEHAPDMPSRERLGRVVAAHRDAFTLAVDHGTIQAVLAGAFRASISRRIELPAVGDWVEVEGARTPGASMIRRVLPRSGVLSRKQPGRETEEQALAANVDIVCIVLALDFPRNHHPRSVERYLTAVWESGARPFIVLNKSDLAEDLEGALASIEYAAPGVDMAAVSCVTGDGIAEATAGFGAGETVVLLGRSGVGKSSFLNALAGKEINATGEVRESDRKGRHTTTVRELIRLESGLLLIDTPGLREFAPFSHRSDGSGESNGLDQTFDDIAEYAESCRFRDCTHSGEPGCAVQAALAAGEIDQARFENYLHLQRELAWLRSKDDQRERQAREARNRQIGKLQRQFKKKGDRR